MLLVSSAKDGELDALRRAIDAEDANTDTATSDDVEQGKPAPDPLHHARPVLDTLFGRGAVHTLDGDSHRVRKDMFVSPLMYDRASGRCSTRVRRYWGRAGPPRTGRGSRWSSSRRRPAFWPGRSATGRACPCHRPRPTSSPPTAWPWSTASRLPARATGGPAAQLAPRTLQQLERDEQQARPTAFASQELPKARGIQGVEAYGRQAMVRMAGDSLFLSLFTAGWTVVAAGYTPRPGKPYTCLLGR
ncbi:hypothetical protein ACIGBH_25260 [Streptomyces sp. NPDC085929]|uniref:hypothetical protein n=1 Tax=Streptomyces sp. NPDC085929 TaxID=3365739 RepID=UPI0037D1231F